MLLVNSPETLHVNPRDAIGNVRTRRSVSSFPKPALHTASLTKKLRLAGDLADYLKASPDSSSLTVGPHGVDDPQVCFSIHTFQVVMPSSSEGGNIVVMETNDGRFITQDSTNSTSITLTNGVAPQQTQVTDNRFFRMYRHPGDRYVKLRHLHSGMYLSASRSGVSLQSTGDDLSNSMLFSEFHCTHT